MEVEVGTKLCNETFELMDLPLLIQLRLSQNNGCRLSWSQNILNAGWWTWSERTTPKRPSGQIQEFPSHSAYVFGRARTFVCWVGWLWGVRD